MKLTIKPLLGKVKDFALEYTKAFASMFGGLVSIIVSAVFHFHSIWQLDIICVNAVWQTASWIPSLGGIYPYSIHPFIDGPIYHGTVGGAYDFFLGMNTVGWGLGMVGIFLFMLGIILFYRANLLEAKSILSDNGLDKPLFPDTP